MKPKKIINEGEGLGWDEFMTPLKNFRFRHTETLIDPNRPWKVERKLVVPIHVQEVLIKNLNPLLLHFHKKFH